GAQRVIDRQRLLVVDVEAGISEPPALQRIDDRGGIADRPARGVDEDRARLHQPDLPGADEAAAAVAQHEMHRQDVGTAEQLVLLDPLDALRGGFFRCQVLTPGDPLHAERGPAPGDAAAEAAETQEAQRLARDAMADARLPAALAHERVI